MGKAYDNFTFSIGGTAHVVICSKDRKWIPIAMYALPPKMVVTFGVSSSRFIEHVSAMIPGQRGYWEEDNFCVEQNGYKLRLRLTTFNKEWPKLLNLPLSRDV